jgi:AbiV family abortive infection protein
MPDFVTTDYLLKGAAYALEQSGLLIRDANALYRSEAYASTVALAAFALEEMGKSRMLFTLRQEVVGGKQITLEGVEKYCFGHHEAKQKAGMGSVVMREDGEGLIRAVIDAKPGTDEWKAAYENITKKTEEVAARLPRERHDDRLTALYVDPLSATEWSRPVGKFTREYARNFLTDAVNDYSLRQSQGYTHLEFVKSNDPELAEALAKWTDRPAMPPAEWPSLT